MLRKYKNILGVPGQGVHRHRILNVAIVDVLLTILAAYIIHSIFPKFSFFTILFLLLALGIILHRLFDVRTTIDNLLFKN